MAHSHRYNRSIQAVIGFYESGKADTFSVSEEVFGYMTARFRAAVVCIQIIELKVVSIIAFAVVFSSSGIG